MIAFPCYLTQMGVKELELCRDGLSALKCYAGKIVAPSAQDTSCSTFHCRLTSAKFAHLMLQLRSGSRHIDEPSFDSPQEFLLLLKGATQVLRWIS
jgi:hypothetical protein